MSSCRHEILALVPAPKNRLRCTHCHLVISEEELGSGCCPECLESRNIRCRDFEEMLPSGNTSVQYRCEHCGMIVEC